MDGTHRDESLEMYGNSRLFMGASVLLSRTSKGCGYDMGVGDEGKTPTALLGREAPIRQSPCPSVDNDLCPLLSKGLNGYLKFLHHLAFQPAG
jgi:hypothetical protein